MDYRLTEFHYNIPEKDILEDLKRIASKLNTNKLSSRDYDNNGGRFTSGTVNVRFQGWNNALDKAGLELVQQRNSSKETLFENIENVWIQLGRQPVFRDMKQPLSKFSPNPYISKFGTFRKALEAFVEFINADNKQEIVNIETKENIIGTISKENIIINHKTKRIPSERLKVQVLMRDGNKCRLCGVTLTGENIHFDHIFPWSKGGETVLENLQILCAKHNLAKGNLEY